MTLSDAALTKTRRQCMQLCDEARALLQSEPSRAVELARRAHRLATPNALPREQALALRHVGVGLYLLGEPMDAYQALSEALVFARATGDRETESSCLNGAAASLHGLGDLEGAMQYLDEALTLSRAERNVAAEQGALINIGNLHQDMASHAFAQHVYEEVLGQPGLSADFRATALSNLANSRRLLGEVDQALSGHQEALRLARSASLVLREPMILGNLAEDLLMRANGSDVAEATTLLRDALVLARAHGSRRDEIQLLRKLGDALIQAGDPAALAEAAECLSASRRFAADQGSRGEERNALERLARLHDDAATWRDLVVLERELHREETTRRAQALALRLQLRQTQHEALRSAELAEELRVVNEKLNQANHSLKLAVRALGIDMDRSRARPGDADARLTAREAQVLKLLAKGLSNVSIGESLGLTRLTIRHYVSSILRKLGAATRTQAVALALRDGLLQ